MFRPRIILFVLCLLGFGPSGWAQYDPPANYYDAAAGLDGTALKAALHNIIRNHTRYPYTSSGTDTWDILSSADEDPNSTTNVLTIYKNESMIKTTSTGPWQREHTWPNSYGFNDQTGWAVYTDCHLLRPSYGPYNNSRSNKPFNWVTNPTATYPVDGYPGLANKSNSTYWEVWPGRRGDIARNMFYAATRYEGDATNEPDLELTDNISEIQTNSPKMGLLSVLLEWSAQDPPDDSERRHNQIVYTFQHNRNPFIDHPEYVAAIWLPHAPELPTFELNGNMIDFGPANANATPLDDASVVILAHSDGLQITYTGASGDLSAFTYLGSNTIVMTTGSIQALPFRFAPPQNDGQSYQAVFHFTSNGMPSTFEVMVAGSAQQEQIPTVGNLQVLTSHTLALTFSVDMASSASLASSYQIGGLGRGTLSANPSSVAASIGHTYLLTWDQGEMHNEGEIRLTLAGLKSTSGTALAIDNRELLAEEAGIGFAPEVQFTDPASSTTIPRLRADLNWLAVDRGDAGVESIEIEYRSVGEGAWLSVLPQNYNAALGYYSFTLPAWDTYEFRIGATDLAGNVQPPGSVITIQALQPEIPAMAQDWQLYQ